jgi:ribosomal protein S18 acetylase RimI-like enzyme
VTAVLRAATSADAGTVARIWTTGWRDGHLGHVPDELVAIRTPASFLTRATAAVAATTVAVVGEEVVGFVMVVDDEVEQVYVDAAHRGSGVAALLLDEAERQVAAGGHATAWLAVNPGNVRARAFYERRGWRDEGDVDYPAATASGTFVVTCRRYTRTLR